MSVRSHVRARLHGVDEPVCWKRVGRMEIGVLALPIRCGGCLAGLIQQGLINGDGAGHGYRCRNGVVMVLLNYPRCCAQINGIF